MDKHTLGNYGWIIVTTIIIIILITIASPAGAYFGRAFTSIADEFSEQVAEGTDGAITIETPPLSTDELQKKYSFEYYSTIHKAVADVNNNEIGANADAEKSNAVVGVYVQDETPCVVMLNSASYTERVTVSSDMIINLGGNVLSFANSLAGIDTVQYTNEDEGNNIVIDGRLAGSKIELTATGSNPIYAMQVRDYNNLLMKGGTVTAKSSTGRIRVFNGGSNTSVTVSDCNIEASTSSGLIIAVFFGTNANGDVVNSTINATSTTSEVRGIDYDSLSNGNVTNCVITTASQHNRSIGIYHASTGNISNCTINADSAYSSDSDSFACYGIYLADNANINVLDSDVQGVHSGICSNGILNIVGGTYKGFAHGGIYFAGANTVSYVKNATIKEIENYQGIYTVNEDESSKAGFYIGGANNNDVSVYMDNCDIFGSKYPFVLRGTSGEINNSLYISNSNINLDYAEGIRIDGSTHKLFIGKGCNFAANDTTSPSFAFETNEVYIK